MRCRRFCFRTSLVTFAFALVLSAESVLAIGSGCHRIDATFTSEFATENCPSPVGLCAAGELGHDGFIKGTTFISLNAVGPCAGMCGAEPPSMISCSGDRTFTPNRGSGTLTAHATCVFDTAVGYFAELNVITGGTGDYAGASGAVNLVGQTTSATTFGGQGVGDVCLP